MTLELATCRVITREGKDVARDDIWKLLKVDRAVLIGRPGVVPSEQYRQALAAETLIIVPPGVKSGPEKK